MKRKPTSYAAPHGSTASGYRLPAYGSPLSEPPSPVWEPSGSQRSLRLPGIDERLARPEEGEEYVDGERIGWEAMAGDPEHADPQCQLAYIVKACVDEGYVAATELLTRTDKTSDFATDVCVRRAGVDPATGDRYLEEISFEVANAQTRPQLEKRAKKLVARGVRRVFGVMVKEGKVLEWTRTDGFKERPLRGQIGDRTFKKPLAVRAILDAAAADRLVVEALWAKREPSLVKLVEKSEAKGRKEGLKIALRGHVKDLCGILSIAWSEQQEAAVGRMSLSALETLREYLVNHKKWPEEEAVVEQAI